MLRSEHIDPFSLSAIGNVGSLRLRSDTDWTEFQFDKSLESSLLHLDEGKSQGLPALKADVFRLNLEDVSLLDLSTAPSISPSDSDDDYFLSLDGDAVEEEVDIWVLPDIHKRRAQSNLVTWDSFLDVRHQEPASAYISELHPPVLSGLELQHEGTLRHVRHDVFLHAFCELAMGRESVLFSWEAKKGVFVPTLQNIRTQRYSTALVQNYFGELSNTVSRTKRLMSSVEASDRSSARLSASEIAFSAASKSILYSIHKHLSEAIPSIQSLLQTKWTVLQTGMIVDVLDQLHKALTAQPKRPFADDDLLRQAANASLEHPSLTEVVQLILIRIYRPSLAVLSEQIGLTWSESAGPDVSEDDPWESILEPNTLVAVHEARQSLNLLKKHFSSSPLLTTTAFRSTPLKRLDVGFDLQTICELQSRAVAYEAAMKSMVVSAESSASTSALDTPASDSFELEESVQLPSGNANPFRPDFNLFDTTAQGLLEVTVDELPEKITEFLEGPVSEDSGLSLELKETFSLSITPMINAQHRLLSYSILGLLFQDHSLLAHLNLQRNFHLLGNAFFSSRLSIALFDSDQSSGEGQRRTSASTGLRLHARDSWPPAGSELRLVLMSILSDSLNVRDRPLEDCISFAIRDMPLEELEKCRDVNSIHALDFLRLQYTAPNALVEAVITSDVLDKYDRIFQHLLRIMRLHAVTQSLLREKAVSDHPSRKAIIEMHHFISTIADYCHNIAIELHWRRFEAVLTSARIHINSQNYEETLRTVKGLDHLRAFHERTLDNILHVLMLKQKQARSRQILEGICDVILQFAAETRKSEPAIDILQERFRNEIQKFVEALSSAKRVTKERPEIGGLEELDNPGGDNVDLAECLLLRLDMSGYWSRRKMGGTKSGTLPFDLL